MASDQQVEAAVTTPTPVPTAAPTPTVAASPTAAPTPTTAAEPPPLPDMASKTDSQPPSGPAQSPARREAPGGAWWSVAGSMVGAGLGSFGGPIGTVLGGATGGALAAGIVSFWEGKGWGDIAADAGITFVGGVVGGLGVGLLGPLALGAVGAIPAMAPVVGFLGGRAANFALGVGTAIGAGVSDALSGKYITAHKVQTMPTLIVGQSRVRELGSPQFLTGKDEPHQGMHELRMPDRTDPLYPPGERFELSPTVEKWYAGDMATYLADLYKSMGNPEPPPFGSARSAS